MSEVDGFTDVSESFPSQALGVKSVTHGRGFIQSQETPQYLVYVTSIVHLLHSFSSSASMKAMMHVTQQQIALQQLQQ
jgi:hypothetical protein